jgi:thiosulfate dehydrogenase (quinone) large subunit
VLGVVFLVKSIGLCGADWLAILRIGLGLWWLESFRHKDKKAWTQRGVGISWAKSVAEKHRWPFVNTVFTKTVAPYPKVMSYVILGSELAVGLGIAAGFLTPIALIGGLLLNMTYLILMIHDWAEQGQNAMMALISIVCVFAQANQVWSIDHLVHILGG